MKVIYHFKCAECNKEISELMEYGEIEAFLSENKCSCGGDMKRAYGVGGIKFNGKGYTKHYRG